MLLHDQFVESSCWAKKRMPLHFSKRSTTDQPSRRAPAYGASCPYRRAVKHDVLLVQQQARDRWRRRPRRSPGPRYHAAAASRSPRATVDGRAGRPDHQRFADHGATARRDPRGHRNRQKLAARTRRRSAAYARRLEIGSNSPGRSRWSSMCRISRTAIPSPASSAKSRSAHGSSSRRDAPRRTSALKRRQKSSR